MTDINLAELFLLRERSDHFNHLKKEQDWCTMHNIHIDLNEGLYRLDALSQEKKILKR